MERDHQVAEATALADENLRDTLATIQEQTRQSLELLRSLIDLLLQQHSLPEGPPLEELIATLIMQQREILTIARHMQADLHTVGTRLASESADRRGPAAANGTTKAC